MTSAVTYEERISRTAERTSCTAEWSSRTAGEKRIFRVVSEER
ncbi:hypothetical protein [Streptosporangium oxazolinicum]